MSHAKYYTQYSTETHASLLLSKHNGSSPLEIPDGYSPRHDDLLTSKDELEDPDTGYQVIPTEDLEKILYC